MYNARIHSSDKFGDVPLVKWLNTSFYNTQLQAVEETSRQKGSYWSKDRLMERLGAINNGRRNKSCCDILKLMSVYTCSKHPHEYVSYAHNNINRPPYGWKLRNRTGTENQNRCHESLHMNFILFLGTCVLFMDIFMGDGGFWVQSTKWIISYYTYKILKMQKQNLDGYPGSF